MEVESEDDLVVDVAAFLVMSCGYLLLKKRKNLLGGDGGWCRSIEAELRKLLIS